MLFRPSLIQPGQGIKGAKRQSAQNFRTDTAMDSGIAQKTGVPVEREELWRRLFGNTLFTDKHVNGWIGEATFYDPHHEDTTQGLKNTEHWIRSFIVSSEEECKQVNVKTAGGLYGKTRPDGNIEVEFCWKKDWLKPDGLSYPYRLEDGYDTRVLGYSDTLMMFMSYNVLGWNEAPGKQVTEDHSNTPTWFCEHFVIAPDRSRASTGLGYNQEYKLRGHSVDWEPKFIEGIQLKDDIDLTSLLGSAVQQARLPLDTSTWLQPFLDGTPFIALAKVMYIDRSQPSSPVLKEYEGPEALAAWGQNSRLDPPTVPPGYKIFTFPSKMYTIAAEDMKAAVLEPVVPWVIETGVMGFGGRYVRMRVCLDGSIGCVSSCHMLELKPTA